MNKSDKLLNIKSARAALKKELLSACSRTRGRTRVSHGRVQQVHGGSAQAQSVHPVRGLFEIRHHAKAGRGERRSAGTEQVRGPGGLEALRDPAQDKGPRVKKAAL